MALDLIGKIIQILPETGGQSKAGKAWVKQEFILETQETYPKKVCISMMGDKLQELKKFKIGDEVKAHLNIESREYNGKWYTNVGAWRLEANSRPGASGGEDFYPDAEPDFVPDNTSDDLPF